LRPRVKLQFNIRAPERRNCELGSKEVYARI
jgi:hypothetical protein